MSIKFFDDAHKSCSSKKQFGLCDDITNPIVLRCPAYISEDEGVRHTDWVAEVTNNYEFFVEFFPVDNCISILRPDGNEDNKCDGLLKYNRVLFFVELKNRFARHGWVAEAYNQLKTTIEHYSQHHELSDFETVEAYICNQQRPAAVVAANSERQKFENDTGIRLFIDRNIVL